MTMTNPPPAAQHKSHAKTPNLAVPESTKVAPNTTTGAVAQLPEKHVAAAIECWPV